MLTETQLVQVPKDELAMLKDMLRIDVLHSVVSSVDVWVAVLKGGLENEGRGEPITCRATVIGACVATLALDVCDVSILRLH